jgi:hypothetical protein
MIQCPKCGEVNPDGFRNCRQCYYPFGLENALGGEPPPQGSVPAGTPPPQGYAPGSPPPPQGYAPGDVYAGRGQAPGDVHPVQGYPPGGAPPGIDPVSGKPMQVLAVRPIRKVHPGIWIGLAAFIVLIVFAIAWFVTHNSSGADPYLEEVFANMEGISGWEADVRVDVSGYGSEISFYLGESWQGKLVFQTPDRFSLVANSVGSNGSYAMRIIEGNFYEWESYSGVWKNMGPADEYQMSANPLWDPAFTSSISLNEEKELQEVDGHMCRVLSFDKEETVTEDSMFGDYEMKTNYVGSIYVDRSTDLLISMDYIMEIEDFGRSHIRYDFHSHGSQTAVEVPPGAMAPVGST